MSKSELKHNLWQKLKYKMIQITQQKQPSYVVDGIFDDNDQKYSSNTLKKIKTSQNILKDKSVKFINKPLTSLQEKQLRENFNSKKVLFKQNLTQILQDKTNNQLFARNQRKLARKSMSRKCSINIKSPSNSKNTSNKYMSTLFCIKTMAKNLSKKFMPTSRSSRSSKSFQAEFQLQKQQIKQYLCKIAIFKSSKFTEKQLTQWLQQYCKNQKVILFSFLLNSIVSMKKGKRIIKEWEMESDYEALLTKLQKKQIDRYLCIKRYIKTAELKALNIYLQTLYKQKNRSKMRQFEEQIGQNMRKVCNNIRQSENNQYQIDQKCRNAEIVNFLSDVKEFQELHGTLNHLSGINRLRFMMINNTDNYIQKDIEELNNERKMIIQERKATVIC